jgi:hypothetical protein
VKRYHRNERTEDHEFTALTNHGHTLTVFLMRFEAVYFRSNVVLVQYAWSHTPYKDLYNLKYVGCTIYVWVSIF